MSGRIGDLTSAKIGPDSAFTGSVKAANPLNTPPKSSLDLPKIDEHNYHLNRELVKAGGRDLDIKDIAGPLKRAGYLSTLASGGPATILSGFAYLGFNIALKKFAAIPLAVIIGGSALIWGLFEGLRIGAKEGFESHRDQGIIVAGACGLAYALVQATYTGVSASATGVVLGMTATEWMSNLASFGVFSAVLIVTDPLAESCIANPAIEEAQKGYSDLQKAVLTKVRKEMESGDMSFDEAFNLAMADGEVKDKLKKEIASEQKVSSKVFGELKSREKFIKKRQKEVPLDVFSAVKSAEQLMMDVRLLAERGSFEEVGDTKDVEGVKKGIKTTLKEMISLCKKIRDTEESPGVDRALLDRFIKMAEEGVETLGSTSEDSQLVFMLKEEVQQLKALEDFARRPLQAACDHVYNTLYDPPVHYEVRSLFAKGKEVEKTARDQNLSYKGVQGIANRVLKSSPTEQALLEPVTQGNGLGGNGEPGFMVSSSGEGTSFSGAKITMEAAAKFFQKSWQSAENTKTRTYEWMTGADQLESSSGGSNKFTASSVMRTVKRLADQGGFESAASAWRSFDEVKARCKAARKNSSPATKQALEEAIKDAETAIKDKYGPRHTVLDEVFCGGRYRIAAIREQIESQSTKKS